MTGALQKNWRLGCVLYQVSREPCYQTAVPMKAKSLCFGRVQTKHCEKPSTLKEIQRHTVQGVLDPNATPSTEGALPRL